MYELNPSLDIFKKDNSYILRWNLLSSNKKNEKLATNDELLVIKIIFEKLSPIEISKNYNLNLFQFHNILNSLVENEIIIKKPPVIKRDPEKYPLRIEEFSNSFLQPEVFTLQWHITNRCDLKCKHCYDRSVRKEVSYNDAIRIMEEFYNFTYKHSVIPQISFTGGNPFLHKEFFKLYRKAAEYGFIIGILGNPVSENELIRIVEIQKPAFYQISIEGIEEYDDYIRGRGHFKKSLEFLRLLKRYEIFSNVMLTLHHGNLKYIFDLIDILDELADSFTFNRLSLIGEGRNLLAIEKNEFREFLKKYLEIAKLKDFVRLKDNLLNIHLFKEDNLVFGGCTGFGCGAAFNFVALLPDGEVHACRKFPSKIGNILEEDFEKIYYSHKAEIYRNGPEECKNCPINRVCRGCLAVIYSSGLDFTRDKDPYCFITHLE